MSEGCASSSQTHGLRRKQAAIKDAPDLGVDPDGHRVLWRRDWQLNRPVSEEEFWKTEARKEWVMKQQKLREHADKSIEILRNNPFFPAPIDEGDNRDIDLSPSDYTDVGPNDRGSRPQHTPPAKLFVGAAA